MTRGRDTYGRLGFLAILFVWVAIYELGPARVQFVLAWQNNRSSLDRVFDPIVDLALPLFAIGFGFAVAILRPRDIKAWLLLGLLLSFSEALRIGPDPTASAAWLRIAAVGYQTLGEGFWGAWFFVFLIYFPARASIDVRWPWLKWLILAPFSINGLLTAARDLGVGRAGEILRWEGSIYQVVAYGLMACALILLSTRYFMVENGDERRRLRLFYWGTLFTLVPSIVLTAARNILHQHNFDFAPYWVVLLTLLLITLFPAVLAYVIVVQRAMDVQVVVRQGLRYALARNGVAGLRAIGIAVVIVVAVRLSDGGAGLAMQAAAVTGGIALITGMGWLTGIAGRWIDKKFFREQVRAEEVLGSLAGDVHRIVNADQLMETVVLSVAASLRVDRVAMWTIDGDALVAQYSTGSPGLDLRPVLADLRERNKAIILNGVDAEVALPVTARGRLMGAIMLGAKRSEQPYSRMELDVLEAVASHTALALENSLLASSLAAEAVQRERLNREVEIAREVQQRLLPQAGPPVAGLEYAGICRPALGVGGDYYDFLQLDDGRFGFAIGDVSGKGFAAALLMASLQASLRGQTLDSPLDLARVMTRVNRLLFDATPTNKYATFFYSQYEPASRRLDWVNAGHNAPLLFRGREIHKLEEGGSVVGLFREAEYRQGSMKLEPGDLLVAFTDGISESMNNEDEEWGEDQLCSAVALFTPGMPVLESVNHLMECADAHAAGAPQHDDMTVVAIRAVPIQSAFSA